MRLQAGTNDVESKYTGVSALLRIHDDIANNFGADYEEESIELRNCQTRAENLRTNINEIINSYSEIDNNCKVISTTDLQDKGDKVHFNSEGQRIMGERFAYEILNIYK